MPNNEFLLNEAEKACRAGMGADSTSIVLGATPNDFNDCYKPSFEHRSNDCDILTVRIRASDPEDLDYHNQTIQYPRTIPLAINEPFVLQQE